MIIQSLISYGFLIFIPLSIAAKFLQWGEIPIFITSALAIVPLSYWLGTAMEQVAVVIGPSLGGLVNAVFGNTTALIIALVALQEGLVDIVKASIVGSIISDLLLFLGLGMLAGGLRYKEQTFQPILARVNGSSMTLAVLAVSLPTMVISTSNVVDAEVIRQLSEIVATILIIVYGLTLLFSLKTHSYLYDVGLATTQAAEIEIKEPPAPNLSLWLLVLLVSSLGITLESELFVDTIAVVTTSFGLTPLFTGVILIPLLSDIPGIVTVSRLASKNLMDLTVATALGDSLLVALFVAPLLVFVGQLMGRDMDLNFSPFESIAVAVAVAVTNLISFSGRSNWLDGTLLLATYIILAVAFYYHPA